MSFPITPDDGDVYNNYYWDLAEGAWREVISFPPTSFTFTWTSDTNWGTTGIDTQEMYYVKHGAVVSINGLVVPTGSGTLTVGDYFLLNGLPFTPKDVIIAGSLNNFIGTFHAYDALGGNRNATGFVQWQETTDDIFIFAQTVVGAVPAISKIYFNFQYLTEE